MTAEFNDIEDFAQEQFDQANKGAEVICFSLSASLKRNAAIAEKYGSVTAKALGDNPNYTSLQEGYGVSVWAVILSVDLRRSTMREVRIGAKKTHLTMHTYLPTMINLVGHWEGSVVGLRGDGLIAQFGETEIVKGNGEDVKQEAAARAAKQAVRCGKAMIETVEDIINPLLERNGIEGNLAVGVGIHASDLVITRIGYLTANELTAYGPAVNRACKTNDRSNGVRVSNAVYDLYPSGKGGRVKFPPIGGGKSGRIASFPASMKMLKRPTRKSA